MVDGTLLISEVEHVDEKYLYIFTNPLMITTFLLEGNEAVTSSLYLPGTDSDVFEIACGNVITLSKADRYFSMFYGSSIFKFHFQRELRNSSVDSFEELDTGTKNRLESKKAELLAKYGMVENEARPENKKQQPIKTTFH